jgi:hypothetical protein
MDTETGRLTDVGYTQPTGSPLVMLNDRELATFDARAVLGQGDIRFSVDIVDVQKGNAVRSVPVDLSAHVRPGELVTATGLGPLLFVGGHPRRLWVAVAGTGGFVDLVYPDPAQVRGRPVPIGVIEVDLTSGRALRRIEWSIPDSNMSGLVGAVTDGAVLVRLVDTATEVSILSPGRPRRVVASVTALSDLPLAVYPAGSIV